MSKFKEIKKLLFEALGGVEKLAGEPKHLSVSDVSISERVVGGKVELIGTDGTLTVLEDGEYILDDGFRFVIKDGLIESIADVEVIEKIDENLESDADTTAKLADLESRIAALESKLADEYAKTEKLTALASTFEAILTEEKAATQAAKDTYTKVNELMKKVVDTPADDSKAFKKDAFKEADKQRKSDMFAAFQAVNNPKKD